MIAMCMRDYDQPAMDGLFWLWNTLRGTSRYDIRLLFISELLFVHVDVGRHRGVVPFTSAPDTASFVCTASNPRISASSSIPLA